MKRIFVSHPYQNDPKNNIIQVSNICQDIVENGNLPISPLHLFSYMSTDSLRNEIIEICYHLIDISDEVWQYGKSAGCCLEKEYALSKGKLVIEMHE